MVKIGHRGAAGYEPENTLLSFKKALELGVDFVELDVFLSLDKKLVVIHSARLEPSTNGKGYVKEKTLDELQQLDAGKGEKIPTLEEVLDLIDKQCGVSIELKGENTAEEVASLIKKYVEEKGWSFDNFLVASFNHPELKKFKSLLPEVKIGALITAIPLDLAKFGEELGAYSINPNLEFINKEFVDDAHSRGLKVWVFTADFPEDIEKMRELGVDGIYSNFPDRIS